MTNEMIYSMENALENLSSLTFSLNFVSTGMGLVGYVLSSLALYTLAKRRGIHHAWLAWIPVANLWILGSLSDQYRYVARGEIKSKRKTLLILQAIVAVLVAVLIVLSVSSIFSLIQAVEFGMNDEMLYAELGGKLLGVIFLCLPMAGVSIAVTVIRFMALYDVYMSIDPENGVMYLVLSIFFNITEPFFLFFNREKDKGMPPRRQPGQIPDGQQQDNRYQQPPCEQPDPQPDDGCRQPRDPEPWKDSEDHYL